ncbi:MAG: family 10 glycosylhydrolase [Terrimicrobiaceae bacterium]
MPLLSAQAEIRGAWITTVHNINFPSKKGLSAGEQKAQIIHLLDAARRARLNAVFFQARPESDAVYASKLEPWSRYLTGTQGSAPAFDPLAFCISEARKRGIVVHAWLNPYRAAANTSFPRTSNHISRRYPQYAYRVGSVLWMDPGAKPVQEHILAVVRDLLSRYDLAGIHFDDYFYPYPTPSGQLPNFPDDKTYAAYRASGGSLARGDWRRENVNSLVRQVGRTVRATKPGALFGISPFGIYRPGIPEGTKAGVNQYEQLFSDPVRWMREGSIDYLAPQLYWKEGGPQSFSLLLKWWRSPATNPRGVLVIPGIAVDRLTSHGWPSSEIATQLRLEQTIQPRGQGGYILWNIKAIRENTKGVASLF